MSDIKQVTVNNLGAGFDVGNEDPNKITVVLDLTKKTIYSEEVAGGDNGVNGSNIWQRGCTVTREAEGRYRVLFDSRHPDGDNYNPQLTGHEDGNRDAPKVWVEQGTKTADGFDVHITVDDNGTGADPFEDNGWSFSVDYPVGVVTDVKARPAP